MSPSPNELERSPATNPMALLQAAIDRGLEPEKLGKLMDLAERWQANQAKEAFARAMTLCQHEMPIVLEDSKNAQTHIPYASLEAVNRVCKPCYTRHGFSIQFAEGQAKVDGEVRIIADLLHAGGHERQYFIDLPRDGAGPKGGQTSMNAIQGKGSTFSYGQRYLVKMIFNLTIAGEDNDGNGGGLNDQDTQEINDLLEQCRLAGRTDAQIQQFWDWIFKETDTRRRLAEMPRTDLGRARSALVEWLKKYGKKGGGQ